MNEEKRDEQIYLAAVAQLEEEQTLQRLKNEVERWEMVEPIRDVREGFRWPRRLTTRTN